MRFITAIAACLACGVAGQNLCPKVFPEEVRIVLPASLPPGSRPVTWAHADAWVTCEATETYVPLEARVAGTASFNLTRPSVAAKGGTGLPNLRVEASRSDYATADSTEQGTVEFIAAGNSVKFAVSVTRTSQPFIRVSPPAVLLTNDSSAESHTGFEIWFPNARAPVSFTAAAESSTGWLSTTPGSGAGWNYLRTNVDYSRMAPGRYYGNVLIDAPGTVNSPVRVPVLLVVAPPAVVGLGPLTFTATVGGPAPAAQSLYIWTQPKDLKFSLSSDSVVGGELVARGVRVGSQGFSGPDRAEGGNVHGQDPRDFRRRAGGGGGYVEGVVGSVFSGRTTFVPLPYGRGSLDYDCCDMQPITRRTLLASAAAFAASRLPAAPLGMPIGCQTWPFRETIGSDLDGTLKRIAADGFKSIELCSPVGYKGTGFAQLASLSGRDLKARVNAAGLECKSCHVNPGELRSGIAERIAWAKDLGLSQMIIASFGLRRDATMQDWVKAAQEANKFGAETQKAGIQLGYHNHDMEFQKLDGELIYDKLMAELNPKLVKMQFQLSVARLGFKAADYFAKYPGRFVSMHLQDLTPEGKEAPLGQGTIDWKSVFAAAKKAGVKNYFVEMSPEAMKASVPYLEKLKA